MIIKTVFKIIPYPFLLFSLVHCQKPLPNNFSVSEPGAFPISVEYTPISQEKDSTVISREQSGKTINKIIMDGASCMWTRISGDSLQNNILLQAQSEGIQIDVMTSGFEMFDRYKPPLVSVYSPSYYSEVNFLVRSGLSALKNVTNIHSVFPFQDEPFHAGPEMFDYSNDAQLEFKNQYGYRMSLSLDSVQNDPGKWLDHLNFQSRTFSEGWKQVYKAVKEFDSRPKVVMTHDSHNVFGAGVKSNSKVAMDDVFFWGGDFADVFVYDIYPYMTFDYRYGEFGKLPKPRLSQMHYTIAQMRNMTTEYGKELGFWVGTYNKSWFNRFWCTERKNAYWAEHEMAYTAIAHGANFLMIPSHFDGSNVPIDTMHWEDFSKAMVTIQKAGEGLLKAPKLRAKACFLFPRTQYLQLQEEYFNVGLSFELFQRTFGELDIIHENQVIEGKLDRYELLVMCDVKLLPVEVASQIKKFLYNGGTLISDCVPQMNAVKEPLGEMAGLFGVNRAETGRVLQEGQWVPFTIMPPRMSFPPEEGGAISEVMIDAIAGKALGEEYRFNVVSPREIELSGGEVIFQMESGLPGLIKSKVGSGEAYLFGFCIQDTYFETWKTNEVKARNDLRKLVSNVLDETGVQPNIRSSNPGIEACIRANSNEGYIFIINHEENDPETQINIGKLEFYPKKIVDIETGIPIEFSRANGNIHLSIDSEFGTTRLLKIF